MKRIPSSTPFCFTWLFLQIFIVVVSQFLSHDGEIRSWCFPSVMKSCEDGLSL